MGISDLTGIEAFVNLQYLHCEGHQVTSLDVSTNTNLRQLLCRDNKLTSLDVSKNVLLSEHPEENLLPYGLDCSGNLLTTLDLSNKTALLSVSLRDMPTLNEVCIPSCFTWFGEGFLPDSNQLFQEYSDTTGSLNVVFDNTCGIGNTKIENLMLDSGISIYPNPINSTFTIDLASPIQGEIEVHSINGQLIHVQPISSNTKQIDLSMYPRGIYFVTVRSDAWVRAEKVVRY